MAKLRKAPSDADGSLMSVGQTCFNDSQATAMFPPIATHGSPILSIIIILAVSWVLRTRDQTIQAQGNSFQKKVMLLFGAGHAVEMFTVFVFIDGHLFPPFKHAFTIALLYAWGHELSKSTGNAGGKVACGIIGLQG